MPVKAITLFLVLLYTEPSLQSTEASKQAVQHIPFKKFSPLRLQVDTLPEVILKLGADFPHIQSLLRALLRVYTPHQVKFKTTIDQELNLPKDHTTQ